MNSAAGSVLLEIKEDLDSISKDLNEIADNLSLFTGVGTDACGDILMMAAIKYQRVKKELIKINLNLIDVDGSLLDAW